MSYAQSTSGDYLARVETHGLYESYMVFLENLAHPSDGWAKFPDFVFVGVGVCAFLFCSRPGAKFRWNIFFLLFLEFFSVRFSRAQFPFLTNFIHHRRLRGRKSYREESGATSRAQRGSTGKTFPRHVRDSSTSHFLFFPGIFFLGESWRNTGSFRCPGSRRRSRPLTILTPPPPKRAWRPTRNSTFQTWRCDIFLFLLRAFFFLLVFHGHHWRETRHFQVGTLDQLVSLSDDLHKLDTTTEGLVTCFLFYFHPPKEFLTSLFSYF